MDIYNINMDKEEYNKIKNKIIDNINGMRNCKNRIDIELSKWEGYYEKLISVNDRYVNYTENTIREFSIGEKENHSNEISRDEIINNMLINKSNSDIYSMKIRINEKILEKLMIDNKDYF